MQKDCVFFILGDCPGETCELDGDPCSNYEQVEQDEAKEEHCDSGECAFYSFRDRPGKCWSCPRW